MHKLKILSGDEIIQFLEKYDFVIVSQKGSHVKMKRMKNGSKQTMIIPKHKQIRIGTAHNLYIQSEIYLGKDIVEKFFFTE